MEAEEARLRSLLNELRGRAEIDALAEMYDLTAARLYRWALSQTNDDEAGQQLVIGTFIALWCGRREYAGIQPWLWIALHAMAAKRHRTP